MTTAVLLRSGMMGNYHVPFWRAVEEVTPSLALIIGVIARSLKKRIAPGAAGCEGALLGCCGQLAGIVGTPGNVELYFKHRYKAFNYRIGKLTEYFVFPNVKAVLNDLYGMKPKILSDVELEAKGWRYFPEVK
jgi:hypothetical protein